MYWSVLRSINSVSSIAYFMVKWHDPFLSMKKFGEWHLYVPTVYATPSLVANYWRRESSWMEKDSQKQSVLFYTLLSYTSISNTISTILSLVNILTGIYRSPYPSFSIHVGVTSLVYFVSLYRYPIRNSNTIALYSIITLFWARWISPVWGIELCASHSYF